VQGLPSADEQPELWKIGWRRVTTQYSWKVGGNFRQCSPPP